jgi:hypothetical protein
MSTLQKEAKEALPSIQRVQTQLWVSTEEELGWGGRGGMHNYQTVPVMGVVRWSEVRHHFRIGWAGLVRIRKALLSRGCFNSCHKSWLIPQDVNNRSYSSWIPRWLQREPLRAKTGTKWRQGCQAFVLQLVPLWTIAGPSEESVSAFQQKQFLSACDSISLCFGSWPRYELASIKSSLQVPSQCLTQATSLLQTMSTCLLLWKSIHPWIPYFSKLIICRRAVALLVETMKSTLVLPYYNKQWIHSHSFTSDAVW